MYKQGYDAIEKILNKYYSWIVSLGLIISVLSFLVSFTIQNSVIQNIFQIIGSLVAGAVISGLLQVKLLGEFNKQDIKIAIRPDIDDLKKSIEKEIRDIVPEVTRRTNESLEIIKDRVTLAAGSMAQEISVLSGAKESGIINIFPDRYKNWGGHNLIETIERELISEKGFVKIMGISLGDYFLDRGVLNHTFVKVIDENSNFPRTDKFIKALILNPKSIQLRERARWESGPEFYDNPSFYDSATFIDTDGAARIAKRVFEKSNNVIEIKLYSQAPTAFILLTSRYGFIEPYTYSSRGTCLPIIQTDSGSNLYKHYLNQFDRIWNVSESISSYLPLEVVKKEEN